MKFQKQKFHHKPDEGVFGDCFRTCLAILLDKDASEVPHFLETGEFNPSLYHNWMADNGLALIRIMFPGSEDMEAVMKSAHVFGEGMPYLLSGFSRTGVNHVVVCHGIEIVCDPSLTDAGIVGPMKENEWWIEFLVRKL